MAIIWLLLEFIILTALRAGSEGTFRFQLRSADTVLSSFIIDIVLYMLSIGAPSFVLRFPGESGLDVSNFSNTINKRFAGSYHDQRNNCLTCRIPRAQCLLAVVHLSARSEPNYDYCWVATRWQ